MGGSTHSWKRPPPASRSLREFLVSIDVEATRTLAGISRGGVRGLRAVLPAWTPGQLLVDHGSEPIPRSRTHGASADQSVLGDGKHRQARDRTQFHHGTDANAMGSRLYSNTSSLVGGRDFQNPEHRSEVARNHGIPWRAFDSHQSLASPTIRSSTPPWTEKSRRSGWWPPIRRTPGSARGTFRARAREAANSWWSRTCIGLTETAQMADLYLPAAGWGEKEGTQINSERRIGLTKRVKRPPGQAMADFEIFRLVGMASGLGEWFDRLSSPEAAFGLMKDLSKGRPHDFTGIKGYVHVDAAGGIQWPYPEGGFADTRTQLPRDGLPPEFRSVVSGDEGGRRLFGSGEFFTADGKAKFLFDPLESSRGTRRWYLRSGPDDWARGFFPMAYPQPHEQIRCVAQPFADRTPSADEPPGRCPSRDPQR
jgi:hypothetical protein